MGGWKSIAAIEQAFVFVTVTSPSTGNFVGGTIDAGEIPNVMLWIGAATKFWWFGIVLGSLGNLVARSTLIVSLFTHPPGWAPTIVTIVRSCGTGAAGTNVEFGCVPVPSRSKLSSILSCISAINPRRLIVVATIVGFSGVAVPFVSTFFGHESPWKPEAAAN